MIKKFTRIVLTAVMPISMIVGCGNTEKTEAKEPKAIQSEKRIIRITHMETKV